MKAKTFQIDNLRCKGCANTITRKLMSEDGVSEVDINFADSSVTVSFNEEKISDRHIVRIMSGLGYPPADEGNMGHKAKSILSCAIGRISPVT